MYIYYIYNKFYKMDQLRNTALSQTELVAAKQRFALFSQPPPLAIGDDSKYKTTLHPRDQNGKPKTEPKNLSVSPTKTGQVKSSYFKVPQSIYIGDIYIDPHKRQLLYLNGRYRKGKYHQNQFKPSSNYKQLANSAYEYKPQQTSQKNKINKDQNGRVKTEPRNMQTNPTSKVQYQLFKYPKYIQDPIDRKKQIQRQYLKKKQYKYGQTQFKTTSHPLTTFDKPSIIFGTDKHFPQKKLKTQQDFRKSRFKHQAPFKPTKKHTGYISNFPEYLPQGKFPTLKRNTEKSQKQIFKPTGGGIVLSRPTPSITLNHLNLRKSSKF